MLSLVGVLNCPLLSRAPVVSCVVTVSQVSLCDVTFAGCGA